jgi:hypothetical protein
MNWPTRSFSRFVGLNYLASISGIGLLFLVSNYFCNIERFGARFVAWIGRNGIGILMFHFIGFKFAFLACAPNDLTKLVPNADQSWLLFSTSGLVFASVITFMSLRSSFLRRYLLGKW